VTLAALVLPAATLAALALPAVGLGAAHPAPADTAALLPPIRAALDRRDHAGAARLAAEAAGRIAATRRVDSLTLAACFDLEFEARARTAPRDERTGEIALLSLGVRERRLGPGHPDVATSLRNLGRFESGRGRYAEARAAHEREVAICEQAFGPDHPRVAVALHELADALLFERRRDDAIPVAERALAIREKAFGPDGLETARSLMQMGNVAIVLGQPGLAAARFRRALAAFERTMGPDDESVGALHGSLANALFQAEDPVGAIDHAVPAARIVEARLGPSHPTLASTLSILAQARARLGEYAEAVRLLERVVAIREAAFGPGHVQTVSSLMSLGDVRGLLGEHDESLALARRALGAQRGAYPPGHQSVAAAMVYVARAELRAGNAASACSLFAAGIHDWSAAVGDSTPSVLNSRAGYAEALRLAGRPLESARELESLLATAGRRGLEWMLPQLHHDLGLARRELGDRASARRAFEASRDAGLALYGPDDARVAHPLDALARMAFEDGDRAGALRLALDAERASLDHFRRVAGGLGEREALVHVGDRLSGLDVALAAVAAGDAAPAGVHAAWDALVASRSAVLDEMTRRLRAARASGDPATDSLVSERAAASGQLAALLVRGATDSAAVRALRDRVSRAERSLALRSAAFRRARAEAAVRFADVDAALSDREALVAFARYVPPVGAPAAGGPEAAHYVAFVRPARGRAPRVVPVGPAADVESAISTWLATLTLPVATAPDGDARTRAAGRAVRARVWDPLARALAGAERVFVVPDGSLSLVSFAALPDGRERFVVESGPTIHLLTTERDVVRMREATPAGRGLLVVGGVDYESAGGGVAGDAAAPAPAFRGPLAGCPSFRSLRFGALPGSRDEAERIAALWPAGEPLARLEGAAASEAAFKRLAPGRRVAHVATHGFALGAECGAGLPGSRGIGALAPAVAGTAAPAAGGTGGAVAAGASAAGGAALAAGATPAAGGAVAGPVPHPLRLAGLALAGANRRDAAPPDGEDGVLTAEEISALDLSGVEWAVLSACESGVGGAAAGESVSGLRRALVMAGVRTVVSSLWSVADRPAAEWMAALYRHRLGDRLDTAESVRRASLETLRARRAAGLGTHPFHWAGFVAAGDWR
jgi:CHAT domain-containing protein/tetratricopeptide (TPR) repeat protein